MVGAMPGEKGHVAAGLLFRHVSSVSFMLTPECSPSPPNILLNSFAPQTRLLVFSPEEEEEEEVEKEEVEEDSGSGGDKEKEGADGSGNNDDDGFLSFRVFF